MACPLIDVRTKNVHTARMKNVTISVDEGLLRRARQRAGAEHRTINELVREWMGQYVGQASAAASYEALMRRLDHVSSGRRFTREEMHERR